MKNYNKGVGLYQNLAPTKGLANAGRRERWLNIINDHILQVITGEIL